MSTATSSSPDFKVARTHSIRIAAPRISRLAASSALSALRAECGLTSSSEQGAIRTQSVQFMLPYQRTSQYDPPLADCNRTRRSRRLSPSRRPPRCAQRRLHQRGHAAPGVLQTMGRMGWPWQVGGSTTSIVAGDLPRRALRLVEDWRKLHLADLHAAWDLASEREDPGTIDPLP